MVPVWGVSMATESGNNADNCQVKIKDCTETYACCIVVLMDELMEFVIARLHDSGHRLNNENRTKNKTKY